MKKFLLILSLFAITSTSLHAQEEEAAAIQDNLRPMAGDIGFTFGLNNVLSGGTAGWFNTALGFNTPTLLFRYYLTEDVALRGSLSYSMFRETDVNVIAGIETTERISDHSVQLAAGAQYSLGDHNRLEPYVGADLLLSHSRSSTFIREEVVDGELFPDRQAGHFTEDDFSTGSIWGVGLVPVLGFNYYLTRNFALGAEFGWGYRATFTGGGSGSFTERDETGTTTVSYDGDSRNRTGNFGTFGTGALAVSVFF